MGCTRRRGTPENGGGGKTSPHNVILRLSRERGVALSSRYRRITEAAAEAMGVELVSIWLFNESRTELRCVERYRRSNRSHERGIVLEVGRYPRYFRAVEENRFIVADNARTHGDTRELRDDYLVPLGITSMLDAPIRLHGGTVGVICHEHIGRPRRWTEEEKSFAASMADVVSLAIEAARLSKAEKRIRHLNRVLRAIHGVHRIILGERDRRRLLQAVCAALVESRGYYAAWIVLLDDSGDIDCAAEAGMGDAFESLLEAFSGGDHLPACAEALSRPGVLVIEDPERDCPGCPLSATRRGVGMFAVRLEHAGRVFGLFVVCLPSRLLGDAEEQAVFEDFAGDISSALHSKEMERERRLAEERLARAQKMKAVGTLAAGLAHDFNNILTGIMGYAGLAADEVGPGNPARADIEEIKRLARRGADITEALLSFSRRAEYHPELVDLNRLANDALRMISPSAAKGIRVVKRFDPELRRAIGDGGQIHRLVVNLLINACEAMPEGGTLTVRTENLEGSPTCPGSEGPFVALTVSDTGIGMDEETKARIFEPFFTTKSEGEGTGLGLAIASGIVERHGGAIEVESSPGGGSSFTVYLPAAKEETGGWACNGR